MYSQFFSVQKYSFLQSARRNDIITTNPGSIGKKLLPIWDGRWLQIYFTTLSEKYYTKTRSVSNIPKAFNSFSKLEMRYLDSLRFA